MILMTKMEHGVRPHVSFSGKGVFMLTFYYVVESIDGDYANLKRTDTNSEELKLVARALLPDEIQVGSFLKYENLTYILLKV